jgi:hypothetical protein
MKKMILLKWFCGIRSGTTRFRNSRSKLVLVCVLLACGSPGNRQSAPDNPADHLQSIYVDESEIDRQGTAESRTLRILVKGSLPSPAYEFRKFDITVNKDTVIVTPLAKSDNKRMAAQVLIPFSEVCLVSGLDPGTYHVKVAGRGQSVYLGTTLVE